MAEYMASPEAYEEYMSTRERTTRWVQTHSSDPDGFYSPSIPPPMLDSFFPSSPPSDAGSSHSLPPKMVLRYKDGRADIPIPCPESHETSRRRTGRERHGHPRSPQRSDTLTSIYNSHSSHRLSPQGDTGTQVFSHSRLPDPNTSTPEEIRVLPSNAPGTNRLPHLGSMPPHHQNPHHFHSRSIPRTTTTETIDPVPETAPQSPPIAYPPPTSHHFPTQPGPGPWYGSHTSSSSTKHSRGHSNNYKVPPAMVYAPSHHGRAAHYAPPPILYHQPQRGPNGIIYSHSAPVPMQGGPYLGPVTGHDFRERERRDRKRSLDPPHLVHTIQRSDDGEASEGSDGSGSTYYVHPSAGQKVHVIAPRTKESVHTAPSTTQSPGPGPRKPFFQRLFGFAKTGILTGESAHRHRRRLQRRHSTDNSGRPSVATVDSEP
ncbi:hypothetical protein AGABI2DRAFT_182943 [Agaricus bisporus var. bisporus H97]|uniref:hypothetical protein n=1 Tax=Agaricus bisporus var. bisporus (strain H97 / ATCC MYA-4626 / FGSC 10389) TaxID=936046 RepID=UPI00029F610D|nr:hypothetical protein AGABI2DRAFT_182943 [Agaricus bisporus var. bisporus H97]EKV49757.1 hypothetical protein AGABI2DRAFT_182943 [Agaricus bisporus var. bisporus H97]